MSYIKAVKEVSGCIFCEAANSSDAESKYIVHKGSTAFIMMNLYPYNNGHLMIATIRHIPTILEMNEAEMLEVMKLLKLSVILTKKVLNPDGYNMGINIGKFAGAGIEDHIHFHVVPRWKGDTNFMTTLSETRVLPETIEQTYRRLVEVKPSLVDEQLL